MNSTGISASLTHYLPPLAAKHHGPSPTANAAARAVGIAGAAAAAQPSRPPDSANAASKPRYEQIAAAAATGSAVGLAAGPQPGTFPTALDLLA